MSVPTLNIHPDEFFALVDFAGAGKIKHNYPYCPECGWTATSYEIPRTFTANWWGVPGRTYMSGPFDWRAFPELRCFCRLLHDAREAGLIDEACAGR